MKIIIVDRQGYQYEFTGENLGYKADKENIHIYDKKTDSQIGCMNTDYMKGILFKPDDSINIDIKITT